MDLSTIVIPFDFPFAILESQHNTDPKKKVAYAVADGQYTYGPLSLFQYHNDKKYSNTLQDDTLPASLPCREFYIVAPGESIDDSIEINDSRRGRLYIKEISQEPDEIEIRTLLQEMVECKNELRHIKSVLSEECNTPRSSPAVNRSVNMSFKSAYGDAAATTPIRNKKAIQSSIVQRSISTAAGKTTVNTPPRSQSVTTSRVLLKNVKSSSGCGQQSPLAKQSLSNSIAFGRSFRK